MAPSGTAQLRQSTQVSPTLENFTVTSGGSLTFTATLLSDGFSSQGFAPLFLPPTSSLVKLFRFSYLFVLVGIDGKLYKHLDICRGTSVRDREPFDSVDGGSP